MHFAAALKPTRAEILRGIRVSRVLRHAPRYWLQGKLCSLHRYSEVVDQIDVFWSHSWKFSAWTKYVNLLFLANFAPAFVAGAMAAALAYVLFVAGLLPDWQSNSWWRCNWCSLSGVGAYYLTIFFLQRQIMGFLDVACIEQHDVQLKTEGLISLGATLRISKSMVVLWDPTFVTRLWCLGCLLAGYLDFKLLVSNFFGAVQKSAEVCLRAQCLPSQPKPNSARAPRDLPAISGASPDWRSRHAQPLDSLVPRFRGQPLGFQARDIRSEPPLRHSPCVRASRILAQHRPHAEASFRLLH